LLFRYFDDFAKKIPRAEIEAVEQVVKKHFEAFDPELQVTFCGSFRRGKTESGDMDVLVSKPSYVSTCNKKEGAELLKTFIQQLEAIGLITDTISLGDSKFMVIDS
jgi:DNA polymerase beta